ncbi:uncharacterized protein LOC132201695 [Neocloeon triangulifer]|uniref:uncharacterized protein LOC132201695 n=1 Tax=Neocloeon triangulifer TaxID=2078957 RepID=UPI00286EE46C|nr:uncharacterized protein LOC132201695 [Neocloeon triangulifer]
MVAAKSKLGEESIDLTEMLMQVLEDRGALRDIGLYSFVYSAMESFLNDMCPLVIRSEEAQTPLDSVASVPTTMEIPSTPSVCAFGQCQTSTAVRPTRTNDLASNQAFWEQLSPIAPIRNLQQRDQGKDSKLSSPLEIPQRRATVLSTSWPPFGRQMQTQRRLPFSLERTPPSTSRQSSEFVGAAALWDPFFSQPWDLSQWEPSQLHSSEPSLCRRQGVDVSAARLSEHHIDKVVPLPDLIITRAALRKFGQDQIQQRNIEQVMDEQTKVQQVDAEDKGICPICGMVYYNVASLKSHMGRSHHGLKYASCPLMRQCRRVFCDSRAYYTHVVERLLVEHNLDTISCKSSVCPLCKTTGYILKVDNVDIPHHFQEHHQYLLRGWDQEQ